MKLGLHYWNYRPTRPRSPGPWPRPVVDQAGFSVLSVMDHFFQMDQPPMCSPDDPMLESYTTLGYVAGLTERVSLGVLVTGVMYRHPGLWPRPSPPWTCCREAGRGSASAPRGTSAQAGLGVPVVPVAERFERLEETLQICLQMWTTTACTRRPPPPAGRDDLRPPRRSAAPTRRSRSAGRGEDPAAGGPLRRRLQRVRSSPADVAGKLDVLRSHCDAEGRDYDRIQKTVLAVRPALADVDGFLAAPASTPPSA